MTDLAGIEAIVISSSTKFYGTAKSVAAELAGTGITVYTPRFDFDEETSTVGQEDKVRLTREFLSKIGRSDVVYVVDEGGYTGRSVCIEIGYAAALGKPVILSEPPAEDAVLALASEVIPVAEIAKRISPRHLGP
jgi:nucleoside 2-deoxyribosyltransferase